MNVQSINKNRTYTEVVIERIADDRPVSDELLIGFAMQAAGENPSSLFGWSIQFWGVEPVCTVTLNTD